MRTIHAVDLFCGAGGTSTGLSLAAAQGFPKDYFFAGNREQKVKQIGNAVPVNTAKALCAALLD